MTDGFKKLLRIEQVRSSYGHLPLTLSISALNSVLLSTVLLETGTRRMVIPWVSLNLGLSAVRFGLWYMHRRLASTIQKWGWAYLAAGGAFLSGVLWGDAPIISMVDDSHLLFVTLVICGMCAGAATVHAAHPPTMFAFLVPTLLPLITIFFLRGQILFGIMACIYGVSMCIASQNFRRWFCEITMTKLRLAERSRELAKVNHELAERTHELAEVNRLLCVEIANHRATEEQLQQALDRGLRSLRDGTVPPESPITKH